MPRKRQTGPPSRYAPRRPVPARPIRLTPTPEKARRMIYSNSNHIDFVFITKGTKKLLAHIGIFSCFENKTTSPASRSSRRHSLPSSFEGGGCSKLIKLKRLSKSEDNRKIVRCRSSSKSLRSTKEFLKEVQHHRREALKQPGYVPSIHPTNTILDNFFSKSPEAVQNLLETTTSRRERLEAEVRASKAATSGRREKLANDGHAAKSTTSGHRERVAADIHAPKAITKGPRERTAAEDRASNADTASRRERFATKGYGRYVNTNSPQKRMAAEGHASNGTKSSPQEKMAAEVHASDGTKSSPRERVAAEGHASNGTKSSPRERVVAERHSPNGPKSGRERESAKIRTPNDTKSDPRKKVVADIHASNVITSGYRQRTAAEIHDPSVITSGPRKRDIYTRNDNMSGPRERFSTEGHTSYGTTIYNRDWVAADIHATSVITTGPRKREVAEGDPPSASTSGHRERVAAEIHAPSVSTNGRCERMSTEVHAPTKIPNNPHELRADVHIPTTATANSGSQDAIVCENQCIEQRTVEVLSEENESTFEGLPSYRVRKKIIESVTSCHGLPGNSQDKNSTKSCVTANTTVLPGLIELVPSRKLFNERLPVHRDLPDDKSLVLKNLMDQIKSDKYDMGENSILKKISEGAPVRVQQSASSIEPENLQRQPPIQNDNLFFNLPFGRIPQTNLTATVSRESSAYEIAGAIPKPKRQTSSQHTLRRQNSVRSPSENRNIEENLPQNRDTRNGNDSESRKNQREEIFTREQNLGESAEDRTLYTRYQEVESPELGNDNVRWIPPQDRSQRDNQLLEINARLARAYLDPSPEIEDPHLTFQKHLLDLAKLDEWYVQNRRSRVSSPLFWLNPKLPVAWSPHDSPPSPAPRSPVRSPPSPAPGSAPPSPAPRRAPSCQPPPLPPRKPKTNGNNSSSAGATMNSLDEHERKIIIEFCHLLEKSKQLFNGLRELPQYGHKQWHSYFGRTFDVYTKLWKFQQQHRTVLDNKYGLKRWQIGEIASKIGQLYYHFYLRTSETAYLNEAYSFYYAIRGRSYYTKASKEDKCELMVKKLRYYARFIVVCLLLKKLKLVSELIRELDKQIVEYGTTYDPEDQAEWTVVVNEVKAFIKAEPVVSVVHPDNYSVILSHRLSAATMPPVDRLSHMVLSLQEVLIVGSNSAQVKFSELTMDMFRMMQTLEREPTLDIQHMFEDSPRQAMPGALNKGYSIDCTLKYGDNPHKYLLFKPSPAQIFVYLASGCNELPPNGIILLYISADGLIVPQDRTRHPEEASASGYDVGGLITTSRNDITYRETVKDGKVIPPKHKEQQVLHPGDLAAFTRRPMFLIIDSDNSYIFQNMPRHFGQPLVILMSPIEIPSSLHMSSAEKRAEGSLFTLFLHSPLTAVCFCCDIHSISLIQWERAQSYIDTFCAEASQILTRTRADSVYVAFMGDDFMRLLIMRFIFCETFMRMHRAFRSRNHLTRSSPLIPDDIFEHPTLTHIVMDLAAHLQIRGHFHEPAGGAGPPPNNNNRE